MHLNNANKLLLDNESCSSWNNLYLDKQQYSVSPHQLNSTLHQVFGIRLGFFILLNEEQMCVSLSMNGWVHLYLLKLFQGVGFSTNYG